MPTTDTLPTTAVGEQQVWRDAATWAGVPTGTFHRELLSPLYTGRGFYTTPLYYTQNVLLSWDTSYLGTGVVVTGAQLKIHPDNKVNTDSKSFTLGWYQWDGTSTSDWTDTVETNAHAGVTLASITLLQDLTLTLSNAVTGINRTGTTYLRTHLTGTSAPTGDNYLQMVGFEHGTLSANRPRLVVTYQPATTTRMAPDSIQVQSNLVGPVSAIQDDPDAGSDATWLTVP